MRSRERILDAVAAVLAEPDLELTGEGVAARAGVSLSTLFRHFGNLEGLSAAMRERVATRVRPWLEAGPFDGSAPERVHQLLEARTRAFEIMAPFQRVARRRPRPPAGLEAQLNASLDRQLRGALGPELAKRGAQGRAAILAALLSFESWDHLRRVQGLSAERARALLERATRDLLGLDAPKRGARRR